MIDIAPLLAQFVVTSCLAVWMTSAVYNNWRFPHLNEDAVRMVMQFDLMQEQYPEDYAVIKHRKVENTWLIKAVFKLMVFMETSGALLLFLGAVSLAGALLGFVPVDIARFVAILGTLVFVLNWTGFLIGGEYFCYWYCHFGSQATHLLLALWGTLALVLLMSH